MKVLNCYSLKGGVGKTSTAINLGAVAAAQGWRVLLIDIDPQGASSYLLRHDSQEGKGLGDQLKNQRSNLIELVRGTNVERLSILPFNDRTRFLDAEISEISAFRSKARNSIGALSDRFDLIVIDSPPTADYLLKFQLAVSDLTLLLTTPAPLAVRATLEYVYSLRGRFKSPPNFKTTLQMVDSRSKHHQVLLSELSEMKDLHLTQTIIPRSSLIDSMAVDRSPVVVNHPRSTVAKRYESLWLELDLMD